MSDIEFNCGFRYNPMPWIENDESLDAARLRVQVLGTPKDGDRARIEAEIEKAFADQGENGSIEDDPGKTAGRIGWALELGCSAEASKVKLAAEWLLHQLSVEPVEPEKGLGLAAALCLTGHSEAEAIQPILQWYREGDRDRLVASIAATCPWSLTGRLKDLWNCRAAAGMEAPLKIMVDTFIEGVTEAGTMCFVDTGGLLPVFGHPDCPHGREIIRRMVPRILRGQRPNGSSSFQMLRALANHGLLESLVAAKPLPSDWQVVRALELSGTELYGLTWGDGALWVCDPAPGQAMAISPEDGRVLRTVALPEGEAPGAEIGWWEGLLAHTQCVPEPNPRKPESQKLFLIDPATGEVRHGLALDWIPRITSATQVHDEEYGDKLWLCDPGEGITYYLDPRTGDHNYGPDVADSNVKRIFPADQGVWNAGWEHGMLIKSDRNGWRLLDYGDMPFDGPTDYFSHPGPGYCDGLTWDGQSLWALDARNKRLCIIEKTESGQEITDRLAAEHRGES